MRNEFPPITVGDGVTGSVTSISKLHLSRTITDGEFLSLTVVITFLNGNSPVFNYSFLKKLIASSKASEVRPADLFPFNKP